MMGIAPEGIDHLLSQTEVELKTAEPTTHLRKGFNTRFLKLKI